MGYLDHTNADLRDLTRQRRAAARVRREIEAAFLRAPILPKALRSHRIRLDMLATFRQACWDAGIRTCFYCRCEMTRDPSKRHTMTTEHRIPTVRGGSDHPSNLEVACSWCNSGKGRQREETWLLHLVALGILHKSDITTPLRARHNLASCGPSPKTNPNARTATMSLDKIRNTIHGFETVAESAIALIGDLAQKLRDALSGGNTEAELNALADELEGEKARLAAAISANTVAADETPTEPAAPTEADETSTGGADDDTLGGGLGDDAVDEDDDGGLDVGQIDPTDDSGETAQPETSGEETTAG